MSQCRASTGRGAWHMMHEVNFATLTRPILVWRSGALYDGV